VPGEVTIKVRRGGPLLVRGPVTLTDHEGRPVAIEGDDVALCRCGSSSRKPFCDGSHRRTGFDGTFGPAAPPVP
jgi:CDGSH-type Zn-finger protein